MGSTTAFSISWWQWQVSNPQSLKDEAIIVPLCQLVTTLKIKEQCVLDTNA
jgi:hypothetical protein